MKIHHILLIFIFLTVGFSANCQNKVKSKDSTNVIAKRNVIKWNPTPMIWRYSNINFSYERTTSNHGSFSVNAGYFVLPTVGSYDTINISRANKKYGFSISGDKRYYFKKRNVNYAPDGLYWGIFGSFHYYSFENNFEVTNSTIAQGTLQLNGNIGIVSAGLELGYQFVFKNNLTVDLIFIGPALSTYSGKLGIDGNLDVDKDSEYIEAIYDVLIAKYPGAETLLQGKKINSKGTLFNFGPGLRYMIQIGYRF